MKKDRQPDDDARGQFLVYAAEDGRIKIDMRLADETVWLTQPLMADLFQTTQQNISQHIRNVYEEGELAPEATNKTFLLVRQEGGRDIRRNLDHYNLDMRRIPMHMGDWITKLDAFLNINDREILTHAGKISHQMAQQRAEDEYEKFHQRRIAEQDRAGSDFDKLIERLPAGNKEKPS